MTAQCKVSLSVCLQRYVHRTPYDWRTACSKDPLLGQVGACTCSIRPFMNP